MPQPAPEAKAADMARALAQLAAHWQAQRLGCAFALDAQSLTRVWQEQQQNPVACALLPDAQRTLAAASAELVAVLQQFAQGRQALADLGFEPLLEHVESP